MHKSSYGRPIVIPLLLPTLIPDLLAPIVNSGHVRADNLVITWSIPDNTMVLLVTYRLTITNSSGIVVRAVMTNDTTFTASSLPTGAYSVKVRITVPSHESLGMKWYHRHWLFRAVLCLAHKLEWVLLPTTCQSVE